VDAVSLDFTALDFETANSHRGSPCSVGLVKVRDGRIVHESGTLIRPPAEFAHFDGFNTSLHGIDAAMVADAPRWRQVVDWIIDYVGPDTVLCHNAGFDISVLRHACTADQIAWPRVDYLCTLVLARRAFRLPSYRLPFVAAECDVHLDTHHQASDDARCAALIAVAMARKQGAETLAQLAESFDIRIGHMEEGRYTPSARHTQGGGYKLFRPDANPDADPDHPFYERVVVFTGTLQSRTRQMAWESVVKVGGIPEAGVTKRTNILVVGDINAAVLAPGVITTGKVAKVFALQEKGQEIEVMTEDDFLRSL
jgi:DNA polymerase III epsilon subunit-like protein